MKPPPVILNEAVGGVKDLRSDNVHEMCPPDSSLTLRMTEKDAQNDREEVDHYIRKIKNVIRDISKTHIKNTHQKHTSKTRKTSKKRKTFVKIQKSLHPGD